MTFQLLKNLLRFRVIILTILVITSYSCVFLKRFTCFRFSKFLTFFLGLFGLLTENTFHWWEEWAQNSKFFEVIKRRIQM